MTKTQHTPGPWKAERCSSRYGKNDATRIVRRDGRDIPIAVLSSSENAEFIVHACNTHDDLLAALKQIERLSREANGKLVDVPAMLGDVARAALAKVRG